MINTIIIDDEAPARRRIKKLLATRNFCNIIGEAESGRQAITLINDTQPDLILLDIQLKDMTGFDVLHQVNDPRFATIFITAFDQFAIKAFEKNAIDYLLKPYKKARFYEAIDRAKKQIASTQQPNLTNLLNEWLSTNKIRKVRIPEGNTTHLVDPENVLFVKADGYYSHFHFDNRDAVFIRISLKQLEDLLPPTFVRFNRSLLVNENKIASFKKFKKLVEVTLMNGQKFSIEKKDGMPLSPFFERDNNNNP